MLGLGGEGGCGEGRCLDGVGVDAHAGAVVVVVVVIVVIVVVLVGHVFKIVLLLF